ncbi:MAG TPA: ATP-binding protein [Solirubrobacteraceae bacterium]|nr:ATP-binding protein [Solirubrobacteraceae bacterium]
MSSCIYNECDGSGFLYDEETNTATDCRCRAQRIARNRARSLAAVIPPRYADIGFDRYPVTEVDPPQTAAATRRFVSRIEENLDAGRGLWFMGPNGNGKTTLAMLVTKAALDAGRSAARYTLPDLLRKIRNTFSTDSHEELFERLVAVDLLHIDDIGAEQATPWVLEELYSIVNARYEEQRSMVITTNILNRDELCEQITERTVSRLTEMCEELPVLNPDLRLEPRGV